MAFALQADGWYLRQDIIWAKPNPMPESIRDRCTKSHEYLFLLSRSAAYHFDVAAIEDAASYPEGPGAGSRIRPGIDHNGGNQGSGRPMQPRAMRRKRSVWTVATQPTSHAHFATFPPALVEPCILAGSREGDLVLDPFAGSGTTGVVCRKHRREFVGIELNPEYARIARGRLGENVQHDENLDDAQAVLL